MMHATYMYMYIYDVIGVTVMTRKYTFPAPVVTPFIEKNPATHSIISPAWQA